MDRQRLSHSAIKEFLSCFAEISFKQKQILITHLKSQPIHRAYIRQTILKENQTFTKGFLILEGEVKLSKRVGDHHLVFARLTPNQIANIENPLYDKVRYTFTVISSQVKFVVLNEECLKICFEATEQSIREKQSLHQREIQLKEKQSQNKEEEMKKVKALKKLSLPNIKAYPTKKQPERKTITFRTKPLSPFFNYDSEQQKRQKSIKISHRMNSIQSEEKFLPSNFRSQKLFKEHLKSIIKRKIIYQKKQLGVLQAFRQDAERIVAREDQKNFIPTENNEIDTYFKL